LNVIGLFNGFIPLVAIQLNALKLADNVSLVFTTVLDAVRLGPVEEDEEVQAVTDRSYWEQRASKATMAMADEMLGIVRGLDPSLEPKYNKFYVGLARQGQPSNFVIFKPKKDWLRVEVRLPKSEEVQQQLEASGLDVMDYDARWGRYRIRLSAGDEKKHSGFLKKLLTMAYEEAA